MAEGIHILWPAPQGLGHAASLCFVERRTVPQAAIPIGADLLKLPLVLGAQDSFLSIGGAGVFDGVFLVGIIAAFLSPGRGR